MNYYVEVLKKYADFKGRARRSEFWYFTLLSAIISIILIVITDHSEFSIVEKIYRLAVIIPSLAVGVRRMHDVNKSGWYYLIPFYNLILAFTNGTDGPNDYGVDPKNPEYMDDVEQIGNNA